MSDSEVAARLAIAGIVARYAQLGDKGDSAGLAALFHPDGVLVAAQGVRAVGRDRISDYLDLLAASSADRPSFVRHHVSSVDIVELELEPPRAIVRSYFLVLTDRGVDHHGRYRDILSPGTDGVWRFESRSVRLDVPPRSAIFAQGYDGG